MRFYRIHTTDIANHTQQPRGLFVAIWKLVEEKKLTEYEEKKYWENRKWFEANLPVPPFYAQGNPQKAITWYKDNDSGNSMCFRMSFYFEMAKKYSLALYKTISENVPGEIIYEDDFQIAEANHYDDSDKRTEKLIL
jgi:hypothetical protein